MSGARWLEYGWLNLCGALAIAVDAQILVLLRFRTLSTRAAAFRWAAAVGLTHLLFPLVGFLGGWVLLERYRMAVLVFPMGSVLIAILIGWILREATQPQKPGDHLGADSTGGAVAFWASVLLVSYDALLSGPGKTTFLDRFPSTLAVLSFVVVGLLVAAFTLCAAWVARWLHGRLISGSPMSPSQLGRIVTSAIVLEIIVFSFFMIWSGVQTLHHLPGRWSIQVPLSSTLMMAVVLGGILSGLFYRRIRRTQTHNATVATTGPEGRVGDPTPSEAGRWGKTPSPPVPGPPPPQDASR